MWVFIVGSQGNKSESCLPLCVPKILALDYGTKRCGLAETDELQIIASPLETVHPKELMSFFEKYIGKSEVETLVVGQPVRMSGELSDVESDILGFIEKFQKKFPRIPVERINEANTSKMAMLSMVQSGAKKKARKVKENLDKISATIILQQFLESKRNTIT